MKTFENYALATVFGIIAIMSGILALVNVYRAISTAGANYFLAFLVLSLLSILAISGAVYTYNEKPPTK